MTDTKKKDMLQPEVLTIIQQLAVEGEIAALMQDCESNDEKLYYAFLKLGSCDERHIVVYKNELAKYIEEEYDLNMIVQCRYQNIIPAYLFARHYITEIRTMMGEDCGSVRIKELPLAVIKSKFVVAMRELMGYMPSTTMAILDTIVTECEDEIPELPALAMVLKDQANIENSMEDKVGFETKLKILSSPIKQAPIMDLGTEEARNIKQIQDESMTPEQRAQRALNSLTSIISQTVNNAQDIVDEEENEDEEPANLVYLVKQIDKVNNQVVRTKQFDSQREATDYIKNMVQGYPDLVKRFNFAVELVEV